MAGLALPIVSRSAPSAAQMQARAPTRRYARSRRRELLLPGCWLLAVAFAAPLTLRVLGLREERRAVRALSAEGIEPEAAPEAASFSLVALVMGTSDCTSSMDTMLAVPILFLLVLYTFVGLAIVCDEYFCESLEKISTALNLSDDVAGATFMAAGSSAPELFTALITIFIAPGDQGVGTIVGSAVFNICVIVGVTALSAGQVLDLWWYPLTRDSGFYALSIILMVLAMADGQVTVFESASLVGTYVLYVSAMCFNEKIVDWLKSQERRVEAEKNLKELDLEVKPFAKLNPLLAPSYRPAHFRQTSARRRLELEQVRCMLRTAVTVNRAKSKFLDRLSSREPAAAAPMAEEEEEETSCMGRRRAALRTLVVASAEKRDPVMELVSWPLTFSMQITIPDCRLEKYEKWYFATFWMSILWIGLLSFLMVDFASRAGCILQIPEFLMGLTVLAAGTSVPDCLSSVLVARNGQGNMAVCNVLGSNVFNILLGLGAPWLAASLLDDGKPFITGSESMLEPTIILFGYLVAFFLVLVCFNWKLTPGLGVALLFMQAGYWGWNIGRNFNVLANF